MTNTPSGSEMRGRNFDPTTLHHFDRSQLVFMVKEIIWDESYLRHGIGVGPGDVVFDVGANVGISAVFFGGVCGAGVVHSFEPVAPLYDLLCRNTAPHPACVPHPYGLSTSAGRTPITYYPGAAAMSGLHADPERDEALVRTVLANIGRSADQIDEGVAGKYEPVRLECELRRFSDVIADLGVERVDLLKIDVERAELDVLHGVDAADWPKVRQVVAEVHDEDGRVDAVETLLTEHGFRVTIDQDEVMAGTGVRLVFARRP